MEHKAFIIYKSHCAIVKRLTNEQKGILFQQIIDYHESGEINTQDQMVLMAFDFMKVNFDIDRDRYEDRCRINAENGKLGGIAKNSKGKQTVANASNRQRIKRVAPKEEEKEDENIKEIERKIKEIPNPSARYDLYNFLFSLGDKLEEDMNDEVFDKIDSKLKLFSEKLGMNVFLSELENFILWHTENKTVFKSVVLRLNSWFNKKI